VSGCHGSGIQAQDQGGGIVGFGGQRVAGHQAGQRRRVVGIVRVVVVEDRHAARPVRTEVVAGVTEQAQGDGLITLDQAIGDGHHRHAHLPLPGEQAHRGRQGPVVLVGGGIATDLEGDTQAAVRGGLIQTDDEQSLVAAVLAHRRSRHRQGHGG